MDPLLFYKYVFYGFTRFTRFTFETNQTKPKKKQSKNIRNEKKTRIGAPFMGLSPGHTRDGSGCDRVEPHDWYMFADVFDQAKWFWIYTIPR